MSIRLRDLTTPLKLRNAWLANELSGWDAIAVALHQIDKTNVAAWVHGLPTDLAADLLAYAREVRAAGPGKTFWVGRGTGLDENKEAVEALCNFVA